MLSVFLPSTSTSILVAIMTKIIPALERTSAIHSAFLPRKKLKQMILIDHTMRDPIDYSKSKDRLSKLFAIVLNTEHILYHLFGLIEIGAKYIRLPSHVGLARCGPSIFLL